MAPKLEEPFAVDESTRYQAVLKLLSPPKMDEVVWKMHTDNKLLEACRFAVVAIDEAERALLDLVPEEADKEERTIIAGSTIHFDKGFIKHWMPRLHARLSHRLYCVTAIKLFARSMGMDKIPKAEAHRAMDDVNESIAHGKLCAAWLAWWSGGQATKA